MVEVQELVAKVKLIGKPVEAILLTHEHPDHVGGLEFLARSFPDVPLYASRSTIEWLNSNRDGMVKMIKGSFGGQLPDSIPLPNKVLEAGQTIRLTDENLTVEILAAGKAESMTVLAATRKGILLTGDVVGHV